VIVGARIGAPARQPNGREASMAMATGVRVFEARLESQGPGGAWTALRIPFDVEQAFGTRARLAVRGSINGFAFRTSIFPDGDGRHSMMVNKTMQKGASASPGDTVRVELAPDDEPRVVAAPSDLDAALGKSRVARAAWDRLAASHQRAFVEWIESAKRAETRSRRVREAVEMVRAGKRRG
jgi:hypothetical protein